MAPGAMLQPQIVLLKEGTDTSQGKARLISNINACQAVVDVVRTTLGPRGMDKLIHDDKGSVTISDGGAHEAAADRAPGGGDLVRISMSQDAEGERGATSVVLLAGEFLRECKPYIEEGVHPQVILKATARPRAQFETDRPRGPLDAKEPEKRRDMLEKSAATSPTQARLRPQGVLCEDGRRCGPLPRRKVHTHTHRPAASPSPRASLSCPPIPQS